MAAATLLAALALTTCLEAVEAPPIIAIVIDDLGYQPRHDRRAAAIEELLTFAILPHSPHGRALGEALHAAGKEVFLHLPMEAESRNELLGPGALTSTMAPLEFRRATHAALAAIPHVAGVNNHMGSLLTGDAERMRWLMDILAGYPSLIFLDSRTTAASAAGRAARRAQVPYVARDVFLDHERDPARIHARLDELIRRARNHGDALAIGHPYPETLAVLSRRLPALAGVRLVRVSELVERRACRAACAASTPAIAQRADRGAEAERPAQPRTER